MVIPIGISTLKYAEGHLFTALWWLEIGPDLRVDQVLLTHEELFTNCSTK